MIQSPLWQHNSIAKTQRINYAAFEIEIQNAGVNFAYSTRHKRVTLCASASLGKAFVDHFGGTRWACVGHPHSHLVITFSFSRNEMSTYNELVHVTQMKKEKR